MQTLKEMYHARIAWNQQDNINSNLEEKLSANDLKKAQEIINDPKTKGGNYSQAIKDLEKWKRGSTNDKQVLDMLYKAHVEQVEQVQVQEKGKYINVWNKIKDIKGVSNKEKDFISNMDPSYLGDVVKALYPFFK